MPSSSPRDFFPQSLKEEIPRLGSSGETPLSELTARARIIDDSSNWRWYVLEWDGEDTCFGLVLTRGLAAAGQFTLSELEAVQGDERCIRIDPAFRPRKVSVLVREEPAIAQLLSGSGLDLVGLD